VSQKNRARILCIYNSRKLGSISINLSLSYSVCNLNVVPLTVYEVEDFVSKLKRGKTPGVDELSVEHIVNCHPIVIIQLTCMCNCMKRHGYVPDAFVTGVVIPVIKNTDGDSDSLDYRGITHSPVLSKLFEMCMLYDCQLSLYLLIHSVWF